ncbi:MAG: cyclic lactone autoinducer peptide [Pseudobutyrivibrio sp.]|nr:cyclic lactone autoinducer peptide [Pseudobutyrivibrio sp.]
MQMQMNKDFIGKAALKLLEKNAKRNANKLCRNFIYEPTVPKKLKNK